VDDPPPRADNTSPWGKIVASLGSGLVEIAETVCETERKRLKERNALSLGKEIGRIPCTIPRDDVEAMRRQGLRWSEIARRLNCNETTLFRRRRIWQDQDIIARMEKRAK
jgi:DNA invertase Pin-like site-specific DNA recombinase